MQFKLKNLKFLIFHTFLIHNQLHAINLKISRHNICQVGFWEPYVLLWYNFINVLLCYYLWNRCMRMYLHDSFICILCYFMCVKHEFCSFVFLNSKYSDVFLKNLFEIYEKKNINFAAKNWKNNRKIWKNLWKLFGNFDEAIEI